MLHVLVAMKTDVHVDALPGAPTYRAGERYNIREDIAGAIIAHGDGEPLEVQEQVHAVAPETPVSADERAACMTKMLALVPKLPAPAEPAAAPPPAKE